MVMLRPEGLAGMVHLARQRLAGWRKAHILAAEKV